LTVTVAVMEQRVDAVAVVGADTDAFALLLLRILMLYRK